MSLEVSSLRARAHPLRLRMLSLLTGAELSAAEVARELGISQANASYHLRQLAAVGEIEVVGEERVRGGLAKRYRHPWRQRGTVGPVDEHERRQQVAAIADELVRRAARRAPGPSLLADAELWVSEDAWAEVFDLARQAAERLHAAARPPRTEGTMLVAMTAALFGLQPEHGPAPAPPDGRGDR